MKVRPTSTGYRQKAWDALRKQPWPTVSALATEIGAVATGLRNYVAALSARGYIVKRVGDGQLTLVQDTGPRAPSWSLATDEFRDWNIEPPMDGGRLRSIVEDSGLSYGEWLVSHGFNRAGVTRLRAMMNGQRPVSSEIESAALQKKPRS